MNTTEILLQRVHLFIFSLSKEKFKAANKYNIGKSRLWEWPPHSLLLQNGWLLKESEREGPDDSWPEAG